MLYAYFAQFKDVLSATLHLSRDALHIHVGLVLFIAGAALIRGEGRVRIAFMLLLVLCLAGETSDVLEVLNRDGSPNWLGSAKDIANTMIWPGALLLGGTQVLRLLRLRPEPVATGAIGHLEPDARP